MKRYLKVAPIILFPYLIVIALVCLFKGYFIESIFQNNIFLLLLVLFIMFGVALANAIIVFISNIAKKKDSLEILKVNMVVKLIHIPAYLFIFVIGWSCMLTIFTFAVTIILMILDGLTITLSGLIGLSGVIRSLSEMRITKKTAIIYAILQFVFCADVISSILLFRKYDFT